MHARIAIELSISASRSISARRQAGNNVLERRHAGGLGLLVLAADINLAGGVAAPAPTARPGVMPCSRCTRATSRQRGREAQRNEFSIDMRAVISILCLSRFAAVSLRSASPSFAGSPSTAIC